MAGVSVRLLRRLPGNQARRQSPGRLRGGLSGRRVSRRSVCREKIRVRARRAYLSCGRNVKANQDRQARRIGDGRAVVEGWIYVRIARQYHANALLLELNPGSPRESQR